ncbi:MAG: VOC family protein [Gordonia sp. (in: high G+C Gram-positive bacteria)]
MQKIIPNIWFAGNAEEGGALYASAFPGATSTVTARYPEEGLLDFQKEFAGASLTVGVDIDGFRLQLINAGNDFRPNPSISFMVNFDPSRDEQSREHLDAAWEALSEGGTVRMELGEYPFSPRFGWIEDRFGVSWQLILTNPDGDPRPFVMPAFLFTGPAQNKTKAAVAKYTELFDGTIGTVVEHTAQTGPAAADAVMFADFTLGDEWFVAMDGDDSHDFTFGPGVSLQADCADQAEIDTLWEALSAVPEAEQCGWCVDEFGISWQVCPAAMDELMISPAAYQAMMQMKKIVIADLKAAAEEPGD